MNSSFDPLDTQGQERAKEERESEAKLERESEAVDFKWLMGSQKGRRIVWRLLEQAGVFRLSFNTNAMSMAFNEGGRNYGNRILALVNQVCPELYPVMLREHVNGSDGNGTKSN